MKVFMTKAQLEAAHAALKQAELDSAEDGEPMADTYVVCLHIGVKHESDPGDRLMLSYVPFEEDDPFLADDLGAAIPQQWY